jgi:hypothetical protein
VTPLATLAHALQTVLTTDAEAAARASGFTRRESKLGGATFTQTMVFGCLARPCPTLEDLAQTAAACGQPVQPQALDQRFSPAAAECLRQVLAAAVRQVVAAQPAAIPLLRRFNGVWVRDSTPVVLPDALRDVWPGCGGRGDMSRAGIKLQVRLDLCTGALAGPVADPGRTADAKSGLSDADLPAGALRIADLGYFDLDAFAGLGRRGAFWLSRYQEYLVLSTPTGAQQRIDLAGWLTSREGATFDLPVLAGAEDRLPCRLVGFRVPPAVAAQRHRRLREKAGKRGRQVGAHRLRLAEWNLYLTNLPAEKATPTEVQVLARARWQVELLFKRWKSGSGLGQSRSEKPYRQLCEVFATLIAVVVQHWVTVTHVGLQPGRSLTKAVVAVRRYAWAMAGALTDGPSLCRVLEAIGRCLWVAARVNRRRTAPATFQILQTPTAYGTPVS